MACCGDSTGTDSTAKPCGDCSRTRWAKAMGLALIIWAIWAEEYRVLLLAGVGYVIWKRSKRRGATVLSLVPADAGAAPQVIGGTSGLSTGTASPATTVESNLTSSQEAGCT